MDVVQEVEKGTRAPRMRAARVMAVFAILVRQLRKTSPGVALYVAARRQEDLVKMVKRLRYILRGDKLALKRSFRLVRRTFFPAPTRVSKYRYARRK